MDGVSTLDTSFANGKLDIQAGVADAIDNFAILILTGGGTVGIADRGSINLAAGISEIVGGLTIGGVVQGAGTYGSTTSGATFKNNEYFSGDGIVVVVPEPGAMGMLLGGFSALLGLKRFRRLS